MLICYVDESGCTGVLPSATSPVMPVLTIAGVVISHRALAIVTREFIQLKRAFFRNRLPKTSFPHDWVKVEIKGADLRRHVAEGTSRERRTAIGFLDRVMALLVAHQCLIIGRVWVKQIAAPFDGRAVYTSTIQYIYQWFHHSLTTQRVRGIVICDSRNKALNTVVAHSIFTQKFQAAGDKYPAILEMPLFGHSDNHVGLQLADVVCSAMLFPMAAHAYCTGHVTSTHVRPGYAELRRRYGQRLERLQARIPDAARFGRRLVGGVMVDDRLGRRRREEMFSAPSPAEALLPVPPITSVIPTSSTLVG